MNSVAKQRLLEMEAWARCNGSAADHPAEAETSTKFKNSFVEFLSAFFVDRFANSTRFDTFIVFGKFQSRTNYRRSKMRSIFNFLHL